MSDLIENNVKYVRERIAKAAEKTGRDEEDILLVAVSKMQPLQKIYQAHQAGIKYFGENKVQDLSLKISESNIDLKWHFVGHLQSNKINKVIGKVEMIQSVDSIDLLEKLDKNGEERGLTSSVLLQVNTSGEVSKFGFEQDQVLSACELVEKLSNIEIQGLMTIGPFTKDENRIAKSFNSLRFLYEELGKFSSEKIKMKYLSMGMTGDFDLAIHEGSNLVRIGTAIFGARR
jgi:pyridoxal phosphate enzyme (YggS family)